MYCSKACLMCFLKRKTNECAVKCNVLEILHLDEKEKHEGKEKISDIIRLTLAHAGHHQAWLRPNQNRSLSFGGPTMQQGTDLVDSI